MAVEDVGGRCVWLGARVCVSDEKRAVCPLPEWWKERGSFRRSQVLMATQSLVRYREEQENGAQTVRGLAG
jgi:hypothetical protein